MTVVLYSECVLKLESSRGWPLLSPFSRSSDQLRLRNKVAMHARTVCGT